jgi:hypothetical protein
MLSGLKASEAYSRYAMAARPTPSDGVSCSSRVKLHKRRVQ